MLELPEFRIGRGAVLYERYCIFCHGESGEGDGLNAFTLPVRPRDLADAETMAPKTDDELVRVILQGGPAAGLSPYMPAFAFTLTPRQAGFLVEHIRTLPGK